MAQPAAPDKRPVIRGVVSALLVIAAGGALVVPICARSVPEPGAFPGDSGGRQR
jgi:hypothetical protein